MDKCINSVILILLTTITAIAIAAHLQSEYMYFGNVSMTIFWLTALIGTIAAVATGFRAIDILTERFRIVS